jgi:hypothetical protein
VDATSAPVAREHGLDALRVFAFGLLIVYHSCLAREPRAWLRAANRAVFPLYILHQTVTVVAAYLLLSWTVTYWAKLPLVLAATFLVSWGAYEVIRRIRWMRPLFGLRSRADGDLAQGSLAPASPAG